MNLTALKLKTPVLLSVLLLALASSGCSWLPSAPKSKKPAATSPGAPKAIVTPDFSLSAKVVSVNSVGRFVVLSFPSNLMPKLEQTLFLYRNGLKTAEVRVTGPQHESNIVADLVSGDAQAGDSVSEK